jgi:L-alanine-DL-glutamate epimerase-like enolase superfamily enzyme
VEQSPLRQKLTRQRFPLAEDGFVPVPEEPGLGVDLDEEIVEKYLVRG